MRLKNSCNTLLTVFSFDEGDRISYQRPLFVWNPIYLPSELSSGADIWC